MQEDIHFRNQFIIMSDTIKNEHYLVDYKFNTVRYAWIEAYFPKFEYLLLSDSMLFITLHNALPMAES